MAADIGDLITAAENSGPPEPTTVSSTRTPSATTLHCEALTQWPTVTAVHFVTGGSTTDSAGNTVIDPATLCLWKGIVSGTDLTNLTLRFSATGSDPGNSVNDIVEMAPTSSWADDLYQALTAEHGTLGQHLPSATHIYNPTGVVSPFGGSSAPDGWLLCDGSSVSTSAYADLYAVIGTTFGAVDGSHFTLPDLRGRMPLGAGARTFATTVAASAVNAGTDQIAITANNNFLTGKAVVLTTSGGAPGGLTATTTYYVILVDSTHISLATTLANAIAGTAINITTQGTGNHTLTFTGTSHAVGETGGEDSHATTIAEMPAHHHTQTGGGNSSNAATGADFVAMRTTNTTVTDTGGSTAHNVLNPYVGLNYIIKT